MLTIAVLLGLLGTAGCGGRHEPKQTSAATTSPVPVKLVEARTVDLAVNYEAPGTVRAQTSAMLSSKIMGYVREVRVAPGDRVNSGQLLVVIDSRDLDSAVLQARAAEQEAHSGIAEADNGVAAAKAQLVLAQVTFKRMDDLYQKKSISNQEFDEAQARLRTAEAAYQMTVSKRAQLDAKIAQVKQGVESASVMRSYSEIRAPFSGVITEKRVEAGQMATPGSPLLLVEQAGGYRLEAAVEESMIGSVRLGQNVSVVLDASSQTMSARITEIVPAVDPTSRAFTVKASLPSSSVLRTGLFGRLRLPRGSHQALVLPAAAIVQRGELQSVFVVESGIARSRMITVGQKQDEQVEVLSGLQAGERVVSPRPPNLQDAMRVEVR
jgi:RND family efflux transporter MFP subunit